MAKRNVNEMDTYKMHRALDLFMRYIGLELYVDGSIMYEDDEECMESVKFNGFVCKHIDYETGPNDISLEVYYNSKNAAKLFLYYMDRLGYRINIMCLTNVGNKPDSIGRLEVEYANGVKYTSHVYKRDSLKYLDLIMRLDNVMEDEFAQLKEIDN